MHEDDPVANGQSSRASCPIGIPRNLDLRMFQRGKAMAILDTIIKRLRDIKRRRMLSGREPDAARLQEITDAIIGRAIRNEAAGIRRDKVLFTFESEFEEISDEIARLRDKGDMEGYRDIYAKLYAFAEDMMADSYMPMYLFIMYRYAGALLETGDAAAAAQLFEKLLAGTDRLIGIRNTYGLHCLERLTEAAVKSGRPEKALQALEKMNEISAGEFEPSGAVALAVRRFTERVQKEIGHSENVFGEAKPI